VKADVPPARDLERGVAALRRGELVIFPTDTVYALAARALDTRACTRLNLAKGRPAAQPLLWLVLDEAQAAGEVVVSDQARSLMRQGWPGALTLVLPRRPDAGHGPASQGVRQPDHPLALALLRLLGEPIAASSANLHGDEPIADAETARRALGGAVALSLDGLPRPSGEASTIIDLTSPAPRLIRAGSLWREGLVGKLGV
jgi:L-threonylcarbamoyladenylate synthase